jgi:hypothetical protein
MRNSAFPANSARIHPRTLSVRPLTAPVLWSLQPFNPSTLQRSASHKPVVHGSRFTRHSSLVTRHCQLLLTSNSLHAITYATVRICTFQTTLSLAPATLTRYPLPNSFPCHSYANRGGGGVHPRVRKSLKINDRPSELLHLSALSASVHPFNDSTLQPFSGALPS